MKIILTVLLGLIVSIGVVMFYTFTDYGIVALVTAVLVVCACLWKEKKE